MERYLLSDTDLCRFPAGTRYRPSRRGRRRDRPPHAPAGRLLPPLLPPPPPPPSPLSPLSSPGVRPSQKHFLMPPPVGQARVLFPAAARRSHCDPAVMCPARPRSPAGLSTRPPRLGRAAQTLYGQGPTEPRGRRAPEGSPSLHQANEGRREGRARGHLAADWCSQVSAPRPSAAAHESWSLQYPRSHC